MLNLGGEVGCMISEGPWIFVGLPSIVKVRQQEDNTAFFYIILYNVMYFNSAFMK